MASAEVVRARIDSDLKEAASAVLSGMGLSMSDAIRLLLVRVVAEKALPFDVRIPNAETKAAMRDVLDGKVVRFSNLAALKSDLNDDA